MATTTSALGTLNVPPPHDDTMEMSSPAPIPHEPPSMDDIDIDFEDDYSHPSTGGVYLPTSTTTTSTGLPVTGLADDERMLEDHEVRPATADEMMDDDGVSLLGTSLLDVGAQEQEMRDDEVESHAMDGEVELEQDEELLDYGDEEEEETKSEQVVEEDVKAGTEGVEEEAQQVEDNLPEEDVLPAEDATEETTDDVAAQTVTEEAQLEHDDSVAREEHGTFDSTEHTAGETQALKEDEESSKQGPTVDDSAVDNAPGTPTDTGLHPTTIRYGDMYMPLFKSQNQPDGLLKTDNLASVSLAELMQNCRKRLAVKIGEDISEDQELVLGFEGLGLILIEDSRPAFETSLNEIMDVYLQLHRNDHTQDIPPLSLALSLQLKFTSTFATLKQAAAGGQGISSFAFLAATAGHDEGEEYTGDSYEEYGAEEEIADDLGPSVDGDGAEEYEGQHHVEPENGHDGTYEGDDQGEEYYHEQQEVENGEYGHEESFEDQTYEEDGPHQTEDHHSPPTVDGALSEEAHDEAQSSVDVGHDSTAATEATSRVSSGSGDPISGQLESTGDEYADYSSFVQHAAGEDSGLAGGESAQLAQGTDAGDSAVEQEHFPSEDFLEDLEDPTGDYEGTGEDETREQHFDLDDTHGDDHFDHSEYLGEQQEEYHPDYQPGEDDEQFHTAHDFLDGANHRQDASYDDHTGHEDPEGNAAPETTEPDPEHPSGEDYVDFGDDFQPDENDGQQDNEDQASPQASAATPKPSTPLGKRTFEEHTDTGVVEDDEPELKKARAS